MYRYCLDLRIGNKIAMKKILYVICLSIAIISCKKSDDLVINETGTWEMIGRGGIDNYITYTPGTGNTLKLNANKTYTLSENFQQVGAGTYYILKKGATNANKTFNAIHFSDKPYTYSINLERDSLLWIGTAPNDDKGNLIMDGGTTNYVRKK